VDLYEHAAEYAGLPVVEFPARPRCNTNPAFTEVVPGRRPTGPPESLRLAGALADPGTVAWRWRASTPPCCQDRPHTCGGEYADDDDESTVQYLDRFFDGVDASRVTALITGHLFGEIGPWTEVEKELLMERAPALPRLRSLFFAEYTGEETELSWIVQSDLAPLLHAFPGLTGFAVRGGQDLRFSGLEHRSLRRLTVQAVALEAATASDLAAADLPALEYLELWPGGHQFVDPLAFEELEPLLTTENLPRLRHLGLRNSEESDAIVEVLADAPMTRGLRTLDLSLGTLTDAGARVLVESPAFAGLRRLDLRHHFVSPGMRDRIRAAFPDAAVDLSDPAPAWPIENGITYVAVHE
jgi:hypothetical protein